MSSNYEQVTGIVPAEAAKDIENTPTKSLKNIMVDSPFGAKDWTPAKKAKLSIVSIFEITPIVFVLTTQYQILF